MSRAIDISKATIEIALDLEDEKIDVDGYRLLSDVVRMPLSEFINLIANQVLVSDIISPEWETGEPSLHIIYEDKG